MALLCGVLLSFQMDMIYDLSPKAKNSKFMMYFYVIWLFTCQSIGVQTFSEENFCGNGHSLLVPYKMA